MARHGAAYRTSHGRNILTGPATDLMPEHPAYHTADHGTDTCPAAAFTDSFNRVDHAISNAVRRWLG